MKRQLKIDALKGFAILLVVLGHAVQANDPNHDSSVIFRVIYAFHMPLFMFLSGYIAFGHRISLAKKVVALLIPFVSWFLIDYLVTGTYTRLSASAFLYRVILNQDWGLWFLWVLFLSFCLLGLTLLLPRRYQDAAILVAMLGVQFVHLPWPVVGFELVQWYFVFFAAGYLVAKHQARLAPGRLPLWVAAVVLFPVLVSFWYKSDPPSFLPYLRPFFEAYKLPGLDQVVLLYNYAVGFLGIALSFLVISLSQRLRIVYPALCWLGLVTLDIFLTHELFLYFLLQHLGSSLVWILPAFLASLTLALGVAFVVRRSKLLSCVLLGRMQPGMPRRERPVPSRNLEWPRAPQRSTASHR